VIGDSGTGETPQYQVARQLSDLHAVFPFDFVIMLGDNLYGGQRPTDFKKKFEDPYKPLLKAGVNFYASLGNHDNPNQRFYKPFNMEGKRYYTFKRGDVQFFALDSNYMDPGQLEWLGKELSASDSGWKICFFHHPLYSHGRMHGSDVDLRSRLEPILERAAVAVVFFGSRSRLRAPEAAEWHRVFRVGQFGPAAPAWTEAIRRNGQGVRRGSNLRVGRS